MPLIRKYWTGLLGLVFVFISAVYVMRLAYLEGLVPPVALVCLGLLVGCAGIVGGYSLSLRYPAYGLVAEVLAGLGTALVYAVLFYAGNARELLWPMNVVIVCQLGLTALVVFTALRCNMRTLPLIALAGGIMTPLIFKSPEEQINLLFVYMLILNGTALVVSALRDWPELKLTAFGLTAAVYVTYYVHFQPETWFIPFRYVLIFFVVYAIGLFASSWLDRKRFDGVNLYLGLANAIFFVFWTYLIFHAFDLPRTLPIVFVGLVFVLSGVAIRKAAPAAVVPAGAYLGLGVLILAAAGPGLGDIFETKGLHYVVKGGVWLALVGVVYVLALRLRSPLLIQGAAAGWFIILVFWYAVAWEVEWVRWFGVQYIPFLNPGALLWMGLAAAGFFMAEQQNRLAQVEPDRYLAFLGLAIAMAAHAVVGGLLTIQIENVWKAYGVTFMPVGMMLTLTWGLYAASLFFWGTFSGHQVFRFVGAGVLILTAIKALFWDLAGRPTLHKAMIVFVLGLIMIGITLMERLQSGDASDTGDAGDAGDAGPGGNGTAASPEAAKSA